ncbi:MAG: HDOD domain-containing protein [Clostridiales bacterium]|nr:HDOD domain-containing protein [Clostridiales bacterium]
MASFVARQPVFNQALGIYGYELLYRHTAESVAFGDVDPNTATSETIINAFHNIGIEKVVRGKRAFINFTPELLIQEIPTLLPSQHLVIELLEGTQPTPEVLEACQKLRKMGYMIALDDFIIDPRYLPLLEVANIIKVDFLGTPLPVIEVFAKTLEHKPITLLAEKLETQEMFDAAVAMKFTLFQGFFFSRPAIVNSSKAISPIKFNCLQLIRLVNQESVNFTKMANLIKHDVALSYRLLRVVNSAFFGLRYNIKSIRQALAILGMDEIKKWITLISLSEIRDDKPEELITMSLVRARFLELLAPKVGLGRMADNLFMMGLLSLMDAIMDQPMAEIIAQTQISVSISEPLLTRQGPLYDLLQLVIHYERSEWDEAFAIARRYKLSVDSLPDYYFEALNWSNRF